VYLTDLGPVVSQGVPLLSGMAEVPRFDREVGESTFPQFLDAAWRAGVIRYEVDFSAPTVSYYGCNGQPYVESYPSAELT
jgi:uncharacterized protein YbcV (DUF1398 family)